MMSWLPAAGPWAGASRGRASEAEKRRLAARPSLPRDTASLRALPRRYAGPAGPPAPVASVGRAGAGAGADPSRPRAGASS